LAAEGGDTRKAIGKRTFTSQASNRTVTQAPSFARTEFNCEVYGIKQNNAGAWLVTVKIENAESDRIVELSRASGLNLHTVMESVGFSH
jgi:hypothetical protein